MKLKFILAAFVLGWFVICIHSNCTKISATEIGTDLLPAVDNVYTFDTTLEVITNNFISPDSITPFYNSTNDLAAIGAVTNDPQFGKTNSSLFLELKPNSYPYLFENVKDSLYLDSVVFCLSFDHSWGDSNADHQLGVYQMSEKIRGDTTYRVNTPFTYSTLLGSSSVTPTRLDDSVILQTERLKNQLRIRLDDNFGKLLLSQDTSGAYKSDSLFREFFNGFAVVPNAASTSNGLLYFSLTNANTSLKLYYRYDKLGKRDTTFRSWTFSHGISGQALQIQRDRSGSQIENHLASLPTGDSLLYVQTAPGSYVEIKTNAINGFKAAKGNVIIHRAEVSMQQVFSPGENDQLLSPPPYLYLDAIDTSASITFKPLVPDLQFSTSGAPLLHNFGGTLKYTTDGLGNTIGTYTFVISRYLQGIVTRNEPVLNFRLTAPNLVFYPSGAIPPFSLNNLAEGRVKLGGGNHSNSKMKIRIIYSKI